MRRVLAAALLGAIACGTADALVATDAGDDDAAALDAAIDTKKVPPPQFDSSVAPVTGPDKLSDTGLYSDFASRTVAPANVAYAPHYEHWVDGATQKRWLYLPPNSRIDTSNMGGWLFPVGTKAWKELSFGGRVIETRMLWKERADAWFEVAYVWAADGSDAYAQPNGEKNALDAGHDVPNQTQCNDCHFNVTDTLIGVSALQLSNGGNGLLTTFASQGKLTVNPGTEYDVPGDGGVKAALAYLHTNCGHCHNDSSHIILQTPLHLDVEPDDVTIDTTGAYASAMHLVMKHTTPNGDTLAIVPGDPDHSGLLWRMSTRNTSWQMPPFGTLEVDDAGVQLVRDWIASLPP